MDRDHGPYCSLSSSLLFFPQPDLQPICHRPTLPCSAPASTRAPPPAILPRRPHPVLPFFPLPPFPKAPVSAIFHPPPGSCQFLHLHHLHHHHDLQLPCLPSTVPLFLHKPPYFLHRTTRLFSHGRPRPHISPRPKPPPATVHQSSASELLHRRLHEEEQSHCSDYRRIMPISDEWRELEVEDGYPWCGFDTLYNKYCERMLFFDKMITQQLQAPSPSQILKRERKRRY